MRVLARRLVTDGAAADDLVQTALAHAIERGGAPAGDGSDAWYAAVLKNLSRDRFRQESRRRAREEVVARPENLPETLDAVANAECQRDVADAVLQLDEPYRTAVLLRFFEELPPREIAKRTGQSSETVGKQVTRGLAQLRAKLESRYGDRGAWAVALLPLAGRDAVSASVVGAGVLGFGSAWRVVAMVLFLVGAVFGVRALVERSATQVEQPVELAQRITAPAAEVVTPTSPARAGRRAAATVPEIEGGTHAPVEPSAPVDARAALEGLLPDPFSARVVDLNGDPIEGVEIRWGNAPAEPRSKSLLGGFIRVTQPDESVTVRTDMDGRFTSMRIRDTRQLSMFTCLDEDWVVLDGGHDADELMHIVLAPAVHLAGRTIGKDGLPVAGARVTAAGSLGVVPSFTLRLKSWSYRAPREAISDDSGAFDLGRVATHPDFRINVVRPGETAITESLVPVVDDLGLELVLRDPSVVDEVLIAGTVYESTGAVAAGLTVQFDQQSTKTDALGRFEIAASYWSKGARLSVRAADGRFTTADVPDRATVREQGIVPLVLRLPTRMEILMGQVVDHELKPVGGVEVFIMDGTQIGSGMRSYESVGGSSSSYSGLETDKRGCFVFRSLLPRVYRIRVLDRETMAVHDVESVDPRDGFLRIVLAEDRLIDAITGTVLDHYRRPVVGARVSIHATTFEQGYQKSSAVGRSVETDDNGAFRIENAPWRGVRLSVDARTDDNRGGQDFEIGDEAPTEPFELVVDLKCEVSVILEGEPEVTDLRLLDASGESLSVTEFTAGTHSGRRGPKRDDNDRFPLFEVSQRAVTITLMAGKTEVRRLPVHLDATKRNVIRL